MIQFSNPEHGWILLKIEFNNNEFIEIDFSDVGYNSVKELQLVIIDLNDGKSSTTVNFMLEPSEVILSINKNGTELNFDYTLDGKLKFSFILNEKEFIKALSLGLNNIIPLCVEPHWTQDITIK